MTYINESYLGEKYGLWTILSMDTDSPYPEDGYVEALCNCGTIRDVRLESLTSGESASCGCRNRFRSVSNGRKYGQWTVIDPYAARKKAKEKVLCRCVCGKQREVLAISLTRGLSISCGCFRPNRSYVRKPDAFGNKKELTGIGSRLDRSDTVYGDYILVRMLPARKNISQEFIGICENGHEVLVSTWDLRHENKQKRTCWCQEKNEVKRYRLQSGFSMTELANASGVSLFSISTIEKEAGKVMPLTACKILDGLAFTAIQKKDYLNKHYPKK